MTTQQRQHMQRIVHSFRCKGVVLGLLSLSLSSILGCKDLTGNQPLPAGITNPAFYNTPAGARALRNGALYKLAQELPSYLTNTGLLTDELESKDIGASPGVLSQSSLGPGGSIDERILPELSVSAVGSGSGDGPTDGDYAYLQGVRGSIGQALGALAAYDTAAETPVLRGELYALEGYTEILLADFFCSGVPLSTLEFQGDFTYHASSRTDQVYQAAIAAADSALALAGTNDTIQNLARVVKGRALLDLGDYAAAAQAVALVPDAFRYRLALQWTPSSNVVNAINILNRTATVSNLEGGNGLFFLSGGDPRTPTIVAVPPDPIHGPYVSLTFPAKYSVTGYSQFSIADGVEARLIQAESALQAHDTTTWLVTLNQLRKTATVPGQTVTPLDTLTDPGSDTARVSLTFRERAYWLFLTGHRQGDLRRLIRAYGRKAEAVYPIGAYLAPGAGFYGTDVTAPIPPTEYANPLFHGCLNRDA